MSQNLKPCPFCGGENIKQYHSEYSRWVTQCIGCGARSATVRIDDRAGPLAAAEAISELTAMWNRRIAQEQSDG